MNNLAFGAVATLAVASLIGNGLMYQRYSSHRPLFEVGTQTIRQKDLTDRLDYLYSNEVLRDMILNDVITQAAANEGVLPSDKDVQDEIVKIKRTSPGVISQAMVGDPTLEIFDLHLKEKIALRNLQIKNIAVSDAEVQAYYNQHKTMFMLPAQTSSSVVFAKDSVAADTATQMLKNGDDLKIIAQTPGLAVMGINTKTMPQIPKTVVAQVLAMKVGDVQTFNLGDMMMVVRSNVSSSQEVQPLAEIYPDVKIDVAMSKAPSDSQELMNLLRQAHITVESDKYAGAVPKIGDPAAVSQ